MRKVEINYDRVVFINLTEMDRYDGPVKGLKGGGSFVDDEGYGHEIFNFLNDNGRCYGYTPFYGNINLSRISKNEISQDKLGKYIDDVFVVFTCTRLPKGGRLVCGFYQNARVYGKAVDDNRISRQIDTNGQRVFAEYNIICDVENAFLINRNDRVKQLPPAKGSIDGIGHGQSAVWYSDDPKRYKLRNDLLGYIETLVNDIKPNDEYKYHTFDESKRKTTSTEQIYRSEKARKECIRLKGCYCNICGFDFEKAYGALGKDYIEVHHITLIGELSSAEDYAGTDPQKDLIPVCSNCHSVIHRRKKPYLPEEIKAQLDRK